MFALPQVPTEDGLFSLDLALRGELRVGRREAAELLTRAAGQQQPGQQQDRSQQAEGLAATASGALSPAAASTPAASHTTAGGYQRTQHAQGQDKNVKDRSRGSSGGGGGAQEQHQEQQLVRLRVCVEADGPAHFYANAPQPLSVTLYRRRCLGARGWLVVSVPHWVWYGQGQGQGQGQQVREREGKEALMARLLREAGAGALLPPAADAAGA